MSSEAITRNDLTAILNEVLPPTEATVKTTFTPTGVTSSDLHGNCYYEKCGNVVHVHVGATGLTAGGTDYNIFTLPSGYRPSSNLFAHGTGGSWNNIGYMDIRTNGDIHIRSQGTDCGASITYLV